MHCWQYFNSYILLFLNYISILYFYPLFYLTMTVALSKCRTILTVNFIVWWVVSLILVTKVMHRMITPLKKCEYIETFISIVTYYCRFIHNMSTRFALPQFVINFLCCVIIWSGTEHHNVNRLLSIILKLKWLVTTFLYITNPKNP